MPSCQYSSPSFIGIKSPYSQQGRSIWPRGISKTLHSKQKQKQKNFILKLMPKKGKMFFQYFISKTAL